MICLDSLRRVWLNFGRNSEASFDIAVRNITDSKERSCEEKLHALINNQVSEKVGLAASI